MSDNSDDLPKTAVRSSKKQQIPGVKQTHCLFKHGPGKKCTGTDESIVELLEKLGTMHDTHICGRCWEVRETSADHSQCIKYCIAGTCLLESTGGKHLFDTATCGPERSRNRPCDREPTYRFLFELLHSQSPAPEEIFTYNRQVHWGANTRQGSRKKDVELDKLAKEAESIRVQLDEAIKTNDDQRQHMQDEINRWKGEHQRQEEKMGRVEDILRDALRMVTVPQEGRSLERALYESPLQRMGGAQRVLCDHLCKLKCLGTRQRTCVPRYHCRRSTREFAKASRLQPCLVLKKLASP